MTDQAATLRNMVEAQRNATYQGIKDARQNQKVIAIASGKGGVGKTSLAVNLGVLLARVKKTLLFDADLGLSNVNILLGVLPEYHLLHVFKGERRLREVICKTKYGLDIVAGGTGYAELADMSGEERELLIAQMSHLENYDAILIDVGAGISKNVLSFLKLADAILIVVTPEPTSITDAYGLIKSLVATSEAPRIQLVVNRCKSTAEARQVAKNIVAIAARYLNISIEVLGMVFEENGVVSKALHKRVPVVEYDANSKASASLDQIAKRLLSTKNNEKNEEQKWNFMQKLIRMF